MFEIEIILLYQSSNDTPMRIRTTKIMRKFYPRKVEF